MNELEKVERAQVNETVHFDELFRLEHVRFTIEDSGEGMEYSWTAKRRDDWHYLTPFGNRSNTVKTFKTLKGAKRNFLKQFSHYFKVQS